MITESIVVANDLLGCMGEGLVIGAPNIVVDLNGHTITSGLRIEPGEEDGLLAGIRNGGYDNVVIRNGTVRNYGFGVRLMAGATYNVVENMTLIGNVNAGVELFDADDGRNGNIVRNNTFAGNGEWRWAGHRGSENSVVENNQLPGQRQPGDLSVRFDAATASRATTSAASPPTRCSTATAASTWTVPAITGCSTTRWPTPATPLSSCGVAHTAT